MLHVQDVVAARVLPDVRNEGEECILELLFIPLRLLRLTVLLDHLLFLVHLLSQIIVFLYSVDHHLVQIKFFFNFDILMIFYCDPVAYMVPLDVYDQGLRYVKE